MPTTKLHWPLFLSAVAGLIVYCLLTYAPMLSGEDPEATAHKVDRAGAEAVAVAFVKERLEASEGEPFEPDAFAVYAAERQAFGYLYQNAAIDPIVNQYRERLPLEMYKVEVVEKGTELRHMVDVNPYTGRPAEWDLQLEGAPLPEGEMTARGKQWLVSQGLTEFASQATADTGEGTIVYDLAFAGQGDAKVQAVLQIDSSGVRSAQVHWDVPEAYKAEIKRQDTWAGVLGFSGLGLSAALQLAAIIYAIRFGRLVSWRRGIALSVIFAVLYAITNINMLPGIKAMISGIGNGEDYTPGENGGTETMFGVIFGLAGTYFLILLLAVGLYFSMVAGARLCERRGWQIWPAGSDPHYGTHAVHAMWKGYAFALVLLGLQSVIFLGAERSFGTWYTIDVATSANNLLYPALMPLLAWCAAISEEGVYRLFGITALKSVFRFTFPAVLVSSMIWALGHVQYPIYPYYTRFVEVTLLGLLFSYVFLKHGFMAAVFTHAIADSIMMAISITANRPTVANLAFALFYISLPAIVAYAMSAFGRRRTISILRQ